eukprot:gene9771-10806_t
MSSALVWELVKNNNAFLLKNGRVNAYNRSGFIALSKEAGNLLNVSSAKYSGLANENTVDISADLTLSKKTGVFNKPVKALAQEKLVLHKTKGLKKVAESVTGYRSDLLSAAKIRFGKVAKDLAVRKGYSKKVAKSTRRSKL